MKTVGSAEARARLPELLECVAKGERVMITWHGKQAAVLVPPPAERIDVRRVIEEFRAYTKKRARTFGDFSHRDLIQEGRRF